MTATRAAFLLGVLVAAPAGAASFPARSGETGILDVPDAETVGRAGGQIATEFRFDHVPGSPDDFGPLPLYVVMGLTPRLDLGATMREWGQPGDPRPSRLLFGTAAKLQLLAPDGLIPGVAVSTIFDRVNERSFAGARLALSLGGDTLKFAAFGGGETKDGRFDALGPTAGIAATVGLPYDFQFAAEALTGPRGPNIGGALRAGVTRTMGISLGANYFPDDSAFRVSVILAFAPAQQRVPERAAAAKVPEESVEAQPTGPRFTEDRPRFRLRIAMASPTRFGESRRLQYGPFTASAAGPARPISPTTAAKAVAPTLDELADAQVREQEALADARERRVRSTSDQLDAREKAALDEAKRLEDRERDLTAREQQLDARERRIAVRGAPTQQQRQLESLEAQLAAQERQLLAQERSLVPAIDAARGRERDASTREQAEREEAARLAASVGSATTRAQQIDLRKQVLAARNRQLASLEARLVARGERIDALERQNRSKGERLDAWSRRLDTRSERLDLLEKRASESRPASAPKPAEAKPAGAAKDKAVFVMVVKSPTAIVKERGAAAAAPQAASALHPGVAVEKAVAAATVVTFPTTASQLSELDRETIDNIAKLAAREKCELLIWARAKDPNLMAEAQRRADEIKARVIATGPLDAKQVVTRITTRPGAQGVDVVVSALRETAKPAGAAPAPSRSSAPALQSGESGKRQIREAVQAAQPSIEACIGEHIEHKKLQRAEGSLKLSISTEGRVTKVTTGGSDLAGTDIEDCLTRASAAWTFPAADAGYAVDVPITVMRGGNTR